MKAVFLLIFPLYIYAIGLGELVELANKQNDLILSKKFTQDSKSKELESKNSAYFPSLDVGAYYNRDDEPSPMQSGDIYSAYATLGFDIYDGGKKSAQVDSAKSNLDSSQFDLAATQKSLTLQIVQDFFSVKTLEASLQARQEAQKSLEAQLDRAKQFYAVKMLTKDDVDRLQSSFDTNIYDMESIKFQILSLKKSLELKTGVSIDTLDGSSLVKNLDNNFEKLDATKSLISKESAIKYSSESIDSFYYPNIRVEDTYSVYGYDREDPVVNQMGIDLLENQNNIMLSLNMRLFDYGQISETKEAVLLSAKALNAQIAYQDKEQKIQHQLALSRIDTTKLKIKSASSALVAASSAYTTIEKKYNAGIVDYVVYLDALTQKTSAKALYEASLNELEIAYAIYYYYSGKNIKDFIK